MIDTFAHKPDGFGAIVRDALAAPGRTPDELGHTVDRLERLYRELDALCRAREPWLVVSGIVAEVRMEVQRALAWRPGRPFDALPCVLELLRDSIERSRSLGQAQQTTRS